MTTPNQILGYLFCFLFFAFPMQRFGQITPGANEIYLPFPVESSDSTTDDSESPTKAEEKDKPDLSTSITPNTSLVPNAADKKELDTKQKSDPSSSKTPAPIKKKKKGKGDLVDPSEPGFKRGKALLTRNLKKSAETEFADSYSKEGAKTNPSRTENANLFGLDARDSDGAGLVEKIEDPDAKMKAQFELARSLDRMSVGESEEKAYKEYLKLLTSFPVHAEITPRTHLAIAVLLFRRQEYRPALHHLVKIIKEFKTAREFTTAHYYAGRIYESVWTDRDLERAKKYYDIYLREAESKEETPGNDFKKDAAERRRLIESPLGV